MKTAILSQWYRESERPWFDKLWERAMRRFTMGVPVLMIHNGGPTNPPFKHIEIVPAVEMLPHGRHTPGHYRNCWRSMAYGFELLKEKGFDFAIFIGQNLIPGCRFVEDCEKAIVGHDMLLNFGCLKPEWAYTEYMAANLNTCHEVWKKRPEGTGHYFLEEKIVDWANEERLTSNRFPNLRHHRDGPLLDSDTYVHHVGDDAIIRFCKKIGIIPSLSIIVPTHDGDGLERLAGSIDHQIDRRIDEVIIVGDTCDRELPHVQELCSRHGYKYVSHNTGHHCWGHCQINRGIEIATGDYLVFNDDEDVFTDDAFDKIRMAISECNEAPRPFMFKFFISRYNATLWRRRAVEGAGVGGHQFVVPNIKEKLGKWGQQYDGDFSFIVDTLALWPPDSVVWREELITLAR